MTTENRHVSRGRCCTHTGKRLEAIPARNGRLRHECGTPEKYRRTAGFTLVEMLIVFTVIGVVVAIVTPALSRSAQSRLPGLAADKFVASHALARATAMRAGTVAELHIDPTYGRFWVEVDTTGAGTRDTVGLLRDVAADGVTLASNRSLLCFDARGLPYTRQTTAGTVCQAADAALMFTLGAHSRKVEITGLGKVIR